jgi:hypothetical protein
MGQKLSAVVSLVCESLSLKYGTKVHYKTPNPIICSAKFPPKKTFFSKINQTNQQTVHNNLVKVLGVLPNSLGTG